MRESEEIESDRITQVSKEKQKDYKVMKISGSKILFFVFVAVLDYSNCNNYCEILVRENFLNK